MLPYCLGLLSLTPKPVQIASSFACTCTWHHSRRRRRRRFFYHRFFLLLVPLPSPPSSTAPLAIPSRRLSRHPEKDKERPKREGCREIDSRGKTLRAASILNLANASCERLASVPLLLLASEPELITSVWHLTRRTLNLKIYVRNSFIIFFLHTSSPSLSR